TLLYAQLRRERTPRFTPDADLLNELAAAELAKEEEPTAGADWPQWRGLRRDGVAAATNPLTAWPVKGPQLLWQRPIGESYASFAVVGGRLYTLVRDGASEVVLCWDLTKGEEIWRHAYDCPYSSGQGNGPRATPTVIGDKVYTVGATGILHCLNA